MPRWVFVFMFLGLGIDGTGEGAWDSPFAPIGHIFSHNLNQTIPLSFLALPLMGFALICLLFVHMQRRLTESRVEVSRGKNPISWAIGVSFLAVLIECANGYRAGGDMQMAKVQVQFFVLSLLMGYLVYFRVRGVRDYRSLGTVILAAACSKALIVLWAYYTIVPRPAVATIHGDSILFAAAATILIARFSEQPILRNALLSLSMLPLFVGAMIANNRRLVWVELVAAVAVVYCLGRRSQVKRLLTLVAVPLLLAYVAVGWNSKASAFAPIRSLRSVGDADLDASTMFRDLENYNLLATMRIRPIIGTGFGQQFDQPVTTPDISFFREYRYMPHNSVLGLWGFTGWLGFTGLFTALVVGVFLAARGYHFARLPDERAAALVAISVILIYLIQCWGDIGFSDRVAVPLLGPALAVAGHLAVSSGALDASLRAVKAGRRI